MRLADRLFPKERLELLDDGDLSYTSPPDDEVHIGCFPTVPIVAAKKFGIDRPSQLPSHFLNGIGTSTVYLHAMHSVVDWFAFAVWSDRKLVRSLSLSPDDGVLRMSAHVCPSRSPTGPANIQRSIQTMSAIRHTRFPSIHSTWVRPR